MRMPLSSLPVVNVCGRSSTNARFDDITFASLLSPELTTICQPIKEMVEKAVELIVNNELTGMTGGKFIFPVSLVARQTTTKKES